MIPRSPAARRVQLARELTAIAVRRYIEAYEAQWWQYSEYREADLPHDKADPERRAWLDLERAYNRLFDSAEYALATCIHYFHEWLAPHSMPTSGMMSPGGIFYDRAILVDGVIYVNGDDLAQYEEGQNFVSLVRADRVARLDGK